MIARDLILFLLLIILPFLYFDWRDSRKKVVWWKRLWSFLPCVAMVAYTIYLAMEPDFIPGNDRTFCVPVKIYDGAAVDSLVKSY